MREYNPDGWTLIENDGTYYVFGSWSGGYLSGDSWRRNSGIKSYEKRGEYYYFYGYSDSVYICHESGGHISFYNYNVLVSILNQNENSRQIDFDSLLNELKNIPEGEPSE